MRPVTRILIGDVREQLQTLPAKSVHCVVTSPPYYALRDYGVPGQIGLEQTPEEYIRVMVDVFREVRRVLRDDGTCWLNIGDSYGQNQGSGFDTNGDGGLRKKLAASPKVKTGCKPKDLLGIPWLLAFALRADGWYLRSEIIWHKPNPMPESVTDRPTKAHEQIFLLSKSPRYFFDQEAVREPHARLWDSSNGGNLSPDGAHKANGEYRERGGSYPEPHPSGRNIRTVWTHQEQLVTLRDDLSEADRLYVLGELLKRGL